MGQKRGHGEGTIYQRLDGRWTAQITTEIDPNTKKQKRKTVYGKSKKEVLEKITSLQYQKQTTGFLEVEKITLGQWMDRWLMDYMKGKLRPKTWESYESIIRNHIKPTLGNVVLQKLQGADIQKMYNEKLITGRIDEKGGISNRTVRYIHAVLRAGLKQALREGLVLRNVIDSTIPPSRKKKEVQVFTQEQASTFLQLAKDDKLYPAFLLEMGTGLRRGELMGLRWQDIDLTTGIIQIRQSLVTTNKGLCVQEPKTQTSKRCIPLPAEVIKELKRHKAKQNEEKLKYSKVYEDAGYVFCWENGRVINPNILSRRFSALLKKAELPHLRFHDLRHTHATNLLLLGENPKVVQERLGHSSISVTMDTYSHVTQGMQEQASSKIDSMLKSMI